MRLLLGGGQWLRKDSPNIAQALAAAAVADWFASLFAATALYHLISPTFGFVCLAIVTAIGILLALREGPFVGLVGIAGGFITPAIVSSDTPQPGVLFVYLFLIQLGTLVLQHKRGWWYLTALGIGGGLLWALGWTLLDHATADTLLAVPRLAQVSLPLFLLATDLTQLWSLHGKKGGVAVSREMTLTARAASIACFAIMAWWLIGGDYRLDDWGFLIALSLAHLAAARRFTKEEIPALVGAAIVILAYASWSPVSEVWGSIAFGGARFIRDRTGDFIAIGLALGAFYGAGGVALAHRGVEPDALGRALDLWHRLPARRRLYQSARPGTLAELVRAGFGSGGFARRGGALAAAHAAARQDLHRRARPPHSRASGFPRALRPDRGRA